MSISLKVTGKGLQPLNENWWARTQVQWAPVLLESQKPYWSREQDPQTGKPWAALSPGYAKWKQGRGGGPTLRLTGKMQDTARIVPKGKWFEVITTPYGGYNQFGTSRMPARPWMGVPPTSIQKLFPIAWKNILSRK